MGKMEIEKREMGKMEIEKREMGTTENRKGLSPVLWKDVELKGGFWGARQKVNREGTIPYLIRAYEESGRFALLRLAWSKEQKQAPHHFWDSDHGKLIEAAAYSLGTAPDQGLEEKMEQVIDLLAKVQQEDGYLNSYFARFCPDKRFTDLMMMHELYCAGHLLEGAIAYFQATGKRKFLDVMCRYVDYIDSQIGEEEGKLHGYDGHPEIELALMRLFKLTGDRKYKRLAKYFVEERGKEPYFFEEEAKRQGIDVNKRQEPLYDIGSFLVGQEKEGQDRKKLEKPVDPMVLPKMNQERVYKYYLPAKGPFAQFNGGRRARELEEPMGHAVRAMYLYCAMADLAHEDDGLKAACLRLWENLENTQLYITGGIGQSQECERFSFAYDLPNENNYSETCASIGLLMWAHRMLHLDTDLREIVMGKAAAVPCSSYGDMMERALYNGILSGVSDKGNAFFYANYMEMYPKRFEQGSAVLRFDDRISPARQDWFTISCCPANLARTVAMVGEYMYSSNEENIYVHLYSSGSAHFVIGGKPFGLELETEYPWEGRVEFSVSCEDSTECSLWFRIPGWCSRWEVSVNGRICKVPCHRGYGVICRKWNRGDRAVVNLPMEPKLYRTNPRVRQNGGKAALMRGPVVYCLEETDNFQELHDFVLDGRAPVQVEASFLFGGIRVLKLSGTRSDMEDFKELYRAGDAPKRNPVQATAIPYCFWGNRGLGEMAVWLRTE